MSKSWHEYFLDMLEKVASKSKDRSTKVGALIASPDHAPVSAGFNGFARKVNDDIDARHERPAKYKWTIHAEHNAILLCSKRGVATNGCTLYVDWIPCANCAGAIIQSGIKEVVIDGDSTSFNNVELNKRWKEDHDISSVMLKESGVDVIIYKRSK